MLNGGPVSPSAAKTSKILRSILTQLRSRFHPLWRLRKFRWFRSLQKRADFPVWRRVGRLKVQMMMVRDFSLIALQDGAESETHLIFERVLRHGITQFFDIGANVGSFTWHALNVVPQLEAHLFEPDVVNLTLLKRTVARNRLDCVNLWDGAVGATTGEIDFLVDEASGATGSIKNQMHNRQSLHAAYSMGETRRVRMISLDEYFRRNRVGVGPVLFKIDVEGAEREVLAGALKTIEQRRPYLIVECFNRENLAPLRGSGYLGYPLPENSNYLLVPSEQREPFMPNTAAFSLV